MPRLSSLLCVLLAVLLAVAAVSQLAAAQAPLPGTPCEVFHNSTIASGSQVLPPKRTSYIYECCRHCSADSKCFAVNFNEATKTCTFFGKGYSLRRGKVPGSRAIVVAATFPCSQQSPSPFAPTCSRFQACCIADEQQSGICYSPSNGTCCAGVMNAAICNGMNSCCSYGSGAIMNNYCCDSTKGQSCCSYQLAGWCCAAGHACCTNGASATCCNTETEVCEYSNSTCTKKKN